MQSSIIKNIYWQFWFFLANTENTQSLFKLTYIRRWKKMAKSVSASSCYDINERTGLVWEGYPSSGNSTSGRVLLKSVGDRFAITNHTHSANIALEGLAEGKPVVILIRDPLDCVVSMTKRWPFLTAGQCLKWYCRFYRRLMPALDKIVVFRFETITDDFQNVVRTLNEKFHFGLAEGLDSKSEWKIAGKMKEMTPEERHLLKEDKARRQSQIRSDFAAQLEEAQLVYRLFTKNIA